MADDLWKFPSPDGLSAQQRQALVQQQLNADVLQLVTDGATTAEMFAALTPAYPWLTMDGIERLARQVADRRAPARRYLESQSLGMAKSIVEHGKPSVHVRALEGLGVLASEDRGASGVTIIVGGDAHIALLHGPREGDV